MNINLIKEELLKHVGDRVKIAEYGLRNHVSRYEGTLYKLYPNIFTILTNNEEKSFPYCDIATGEVKIKYL